MADEVRSHFDDEVLRKEQPERFVPKAFAGRPYNVFETGGTTGMPKGCMHPHRSLQRCGETVSSTARHCACIASSRIRRRLAGIGREYRRRTTGAKYPALQRIPSPIGIAGEYDKIERSI